MVVGREARVWPHLASNARRNAVVDPGQLHCRGTHRIDRAEHFRVLQFLAFACDHFSHATTKKKRESSEYVAFYVSRATAGSTGLKGSLSVLTPSCCSKIGFLLFCGLLSFQRACACGDFFSDDGSCTLSSETTLDGSSLHSELYAPT